jgi:hypothetical protein
LQHFPQILLRSIENAFKLSFQADPTAQQELEHQLKATALQQALQPGNPPFLGDEPTRISVRTPYGPMVSDQRSSEIIKLAKRDPRAAIRETRSELGSAILGVANVQSGNTHPISADIIFSLERLEYDTRFPSELIRTIPELQEKAKKVVDQSIHAYDPSSLEAQQFVRDAVAAANELARRF